jgi:hypothetical protein
MGNITYFRKKEKQNIILSSFEVLALTVDTLSDDSFLKYVRISWMDRKEVICKFFEEGLKCVESGDHVQASKKMYKSAEEAIKYLAEIEKLEEIETVKDKGRWYISLLGKASEKLKKKYGEDVFNAWKTAYHLHCEGFHERRLNVESVK